MLFRKESDVNQFRAPPSSLLACEGRTLSRQDGQGPARLLELVGVHLVIRYRHDGGVGVLEPAGVALDAESRAVQPHLEAGEARPLAQGLDQEPGMEDPRRLDGKTRPAIAVELQAHGPTFQRMEPLVLHAGLEEGRVEHGPRRAEAQGHGPTDQGLGVLHGLVDAATPNLGRAVVFSLRAMQSARSINTRENNW